MMKINHENNTQNVIRRLFYIHLQIRNSCRRKDYSERNVNYKTVKLYTAMAHLRSHWLDRIR